MKHGARLAAALGMAWSLAGCGASSAPPDVVLVCVDTLRRDHVGSYGYDRDTTPTIDRLAREGVRFAHALAPSNWTVPSVATLLTGLEPWRHGARIASDPAFLGEARPTQIVASAPSLAGQLRAGGYATGFFSANPFLVQRFTSGFDEVSTDWLPADRLTEAALAWWHLQRGRQRFLYLHFMDVHQPNEPPTPYFEQFGLAPGERRPLAARDWDHQQQQDLEDPRFREFRRHRIGAYDGAIRFVDDQIRRFLDAVASEGNLDRTLILVTADHGEEFWDHAEVERSWADDPRGIWGVGHGHAFFQEVLAIPLVVRGPGFSSGAASDCPVTLLDLAPTIARAAGSDAPAEWTGADLSRLDRRPCPSRAIAALSPAFGPRGGALWSDRYKLIVRGERRLLFDLVSDPFERDDLAASEPRRTAALARALEERLGLEVIGGDSDPITDEKLRRQLRELGYL